MLLLPKAQTLCTHAPHLSPMRHIYHPCATFITHAPHLSPMRHIYHPCATFITHAPHLSQSTQKIVLADKPSGSFKSQMVHRTPSFPSLSSASRNRAGNCLRRPLELEGMMFISVSELDMDSSVLSHISLSSGC